MCTCVCVDSTELLVAMMMDRVVPFFIAFNTVSLFGFICMFIVLPLYQYVARSFTSRNVHKYLLAKDTRFHFRNRKIKLKNKLEV